MECVMRISRFVFRVTHLNDIRADSYGEAIK